MSRHSPSLPVDGAPCHLPHPNPTRSFWHSEPSPLLAAHRTTRDVPKTADVVVIGSGITGASVAWHLLRGDVADGGKSSGEGGKLDVVMLEAREACWGATGRNGGHCQPLLFEHPHDPSIANFELANFAALQNIIDSRGIDCEFVPQAGVRAIYSPNHLTDVELALHSMQESSPDLAKRMRIVTKKSELGQLRVPTAVGAVVTDIAARMWPYKFVAHILESLLTSHEINGTFNLQTLTPATSLERATDSTSWLVHTPRGTILTPKVVLATNAHTSHLIPSFASLIVPVRGQMSALKPLPSLASEGNRLKTSYGFMGEGMDDYLIQRPTERGGHLMFGGGRQFGVSVGIADDSVIDDGAARYLRGRLIEALGLPEGKAMDELKAKGRKSAAGGKRTVLEKITGRSAASGMEGVPTETTIPDSKDRQRPKDTLETSDFDFDASPRTHPPVSQQSPHKLPSGPNYAQQDWSFAAMLLGREIQLYRRGESTSEAIEERKRELEAAEEKWRDQCARTGEEMPAGFARKEKRREVRDRGSASAIPGDVSRAVEFEAQNEWTGIMAFSRDDLPWVGPLPLSEHAGLYVSAGYTGHGMPNAWLCGKAVAVMLGQGVPAQISGLGESDESADQRPRDSQVSAAMNVVGLPGAYVVSQERIERAMGLESVGAKDWAEMERGRAAGEGRPPSGYA